MKKLGTWLTFSLLLASLLPPVVAADADREPSELAVVVEAAVGDATAELSLTEPLPRTEEAGLCGSGPVDALTTAASQTCDENRGCATSAQCDGGLCVRHRCFCF